MNGAQPHPYGIELRVLVAVAVGVLAGLLLPIPGGALTRGLVGFLAGAATLDLPLAWVVLRSDADATERMLSRTAATHWLTDVVVILAGFGAIGAVAGMLIVSGAAKGSSTSLVEAALAVVAVAAAWASIHLMYTVRYGRHYYAHEDGSIDFNTDAKPRLTDFAYLAFTLGMTYQVSDTDIKTPWLRRIVLFHVLLSYVFGTGIVAATVNLVVGLAG